MYLRTEFDPETDAGRYLISCARIRDLAMATLAQKLLDRIIQDQLVLAILDDESSKTRRSKYDTKFLDVS